MKFEVTEIKQLGRGLGANLSVRMDKLDDPGCAVGIPEPTRYTIHAVLPYYPDFGQLRIGQTFELKQIEVVRDFNGNIRQGLALNEGMRTGKAK